MLALSVNNKQTNKQKKQTKGQQDNKQTHSLKTSELVATLIWWKVIWRQCTQLIGLDSNLIHGTLWYLSQYDYQTLLWFTIFDPLKEIFTWVALVQEIKACFVALCCCYQLPLRQALGSPLFQLVSVVYHFYDCFGAFKEPQHWWGSTPVHWVIKLTYQMMVYVYLMYAYIE